MAVLFLSPFFTALLAGFLRSTRLKELVQAVGAVVTFCAAFNLLNQILKEGPVRAYAGLVYVDSLGAFNIVLVALVGMIASIYSIGYMRHELEEKIITKTQLGKYYFFFHMFILTMLIVSAVDNLGLLWVGIELTTLVSALLVAFYGTQHALEAAWKYLIMGVVGIALALLGIVFFYLSGLQGSGEQTAAALQWTQLMHMAPSLNEKWVEIGFVFILIGFGAKAGLAPMHFWLPDAHSQAPAPVSAVLSGVLLNTALYGLFRVFAIADIAMDGKAGSYLIAFGLISICVTVPFIMVQHDLKRMLAFSSVEHMGIIALAVGIGGPLGLYGAFLHMFNHSMGKSLLFMTAGEIAQKYHSRFMERIYGIVKAMPMTGTVFFIAAFTIAGAPPFSIFISEFTIMLAGARQGYVWLSCLIAFLVVFIFAGMSYYVVKMVFGPMPARGKSMKCNGWMCVAYGLPLAFILICGVYVPDFLRAVIRSAANVLQ